MAAVSDGPFCTKQAVEGYKRKASIAYRRFDIGRTGNVKAVLINTA